MSSAPPPPDASDPTPDYRSRRRTYLVDREFQFTYLTQWLVMTALFVGFNALTVRWSLIRLKGPGIEAAALRDLSDVLWINAAFMLLVGFFCACYLLLLSHRIAGPAYRLRKVLERMAAGETNLTVTLRRKDYLRDVAEGLNVLLVRLRERNARLEMLRDEARRLADAPGAAGESARRFRDALEAVLAIERRADSAAGGSGIRPDGHA